MKKNQLKKAIILLIGLAIGLIIGLVVFGQDQTAQAPERRQPVEKSITNVQGETEIVSRTAKQTTFRAWCNLEFSDGTKEHRYLGRFQFVGYLPANFGFVSDKCDNTNR